MKWLNHQVVTGFLVYAATDDLLLAACGMAGAIFPDKIEGNPRGGFSRFGWRSRHRGWSHWPLLYLALMGFLLKWQGISNVWELLGNASLRGSPSMVGLAFCSGALLHILEDALCGKVPILTPNQKYGIRLFKVGSIKEYVVSIGIVLLCYAVKETLIK